MENNINKTIVRECYRKILRDLDLSLVNKLIREDYIQHSPSVKTGRAGLLEMLEFLKTLPRQVNTSSPVLRVIGDGDLVAVHLDITFMDKRMAVIDLYRLQDGQLAEHWDAGQIIPQQDEGPVNMTNGTAEIAEAVNAEETKKLVKDFFKALSGKIDISKYLNEGYIEHNTGAPVINKTGINLTIHRIIAEGDFAVAQCECTDEKKTYALYSIVRVEGDRIAEHWSVEQDVPAAMAHNNGMF